MSRNVRKENMSREKWKRVLEGTTANVGVLFGDKDPRTFWREAGSSPDYAAAADEIRSEGQRLLGRPIPELSYRLFARFEQDGSRLDYERAYFARRRILNTTALLSLLEPEHAEARAALSDIVWAICGEYTWCLPAHLRGTAETDGAMAFQVDSREWTRGERTTAIDLFSAETGFTMAEIALLAGDRLPELVRSRIREEVVRRLFKPYLRQGPYGWESARHNWAAVCAGSIGSAALLMLDGGEPLTRLIEKVLGSMKAYLSGFGEDGACREGLGYWQYGFGYFVCFADLLKKRTRGEVDLFRPEKVRRIAEFQQYAFLDEDRTVNFSDAAGPARLNIGLAHYLADLYPTVAIPPAHLRIRYMDDPCSRWAPAFRDLLWFDPRKRGVEWPPADRYFPDAQWLVSRHASGEDRYGFAAKGGHNGEPHNHNDVGHFLLTANGRAFLCDLGSGEYTADYFGPNRYTYDCNGSQGHSVPIVDAIGQAEGPERAARVLDAGIGAEEDVFALDLAAAYPAAGLAALLRRFVWRKLAQPELSLEDEFRFVGGGPHQAVERFVSFLAPTVDESRSRVVLAGEGGRRLVIGYGDAVLPPVVRKRSYRNHFGESTDWYTLDFPVRPEGDAAVAAFLFQFR